MKGVLYISFLVCILLGCSDSDGLLDGGKDKIVCIELEIVFVFIVEGNIQICVDVFFMFGSFIVLFCYGQVVEMSYMFVNNRKYMLNFGDSKWIVELEVIIIYLGSEKVDVCGYYFYVEGIVGIVDIFYNVCIIIFMDM